MIHKEAAGAQSCPTPSCDLMSYTVYGILKARTLRQPFPSVNDINNTAISSSSWKLLSLTVIFLF